MTATRPGVERPPASRLTYSFDHAHLDPPRSLANVLGGKGANLAEMVSALGLPVPPGFTITTEAWREFRHFGWPDSLGAEITTQLALIEQTAGRYYGDADNPLLLSVRSGAPVSMPGMMDTVLNLGLNESTVQGLARQISPGFAFDTYSRFVSQYSRTVLGVPDAVLDVVDTAESRPLARGTSEITARGLRRRCDQLLERVETYLGKPFPDDPHEQLRSAIEAVFRSWDGAKAQAYRRREGLDDQAGTAINVQAMVFGNLDDDSGTGVAFTRDPVTGEHAIYGDVLFHAQGEDVVSGTFLTAHISDLATRMPTVADELSATLARLEWHFRDMCDVEFTIESGRLWLLQTRAGKRSGQAAVRMAVEMTAQPGWQISKEEALCRVTIEQIDQALSRTTTSSERKPFARGEAASPGIATGRAYFCADDCVDAVDRGESVVLVRTDTSPEDVHGMQLAEGILTTRGGLVSHAAVVARGWGIPAVVGAKDIQVQGKRGVAGELIISQGDVLTLDGNTGEVFVGDLESVTTAMSVEVQRLLQWADNVAVGRGHVPAKEPRDRLALAHSLACS